MIRWLVAILLVLAVPAALLRDRTTAPRAVPLVATPVTILPAGRRLFGGGLDDPAIPDVVAGEGADVPVLTGVVGRLPDAAVALVQGADGRSRPVAVGASVAGWRLDGLAADRAIFAKGGRQVRVRLPAEDQ
jgi:hypothetical protein